MLVEQNKFDSKQFITSQALQFDGVNDVLTFQNTGLSPFEDFSVEIGFNADTLISNMALFAQENTLGIQVNAIGAFIDPADRVGIRITGSITSELSDFRASVPVSANRYYHVVFVYTASTQRTAIYINGYSIPVVSGGTNNTITNFTIHPNFTLGKRRFAPNFNGKFSLFRAYSKALTDQDCRELVSSHIVPESLASIIRTPEWLASLPMFDDGGTLKVISSEERYNPLKSTIWEELSFDVDVAASTDVTAGFGAVNPFPNFIPIWKLEEVGQDSKWFEDFRLSDSSPNVQYVGAGAKKLKVYLKESGNASIDFGDLKTSGAVGTLTVSGVVDVSFLTLQGSLSIVNQTGVTDVIFSPSSLNITSFDIRNTSTTGSLDLSVLPNIAALRLGGTGYSSVTFGTPTTVTMGVIQLADMVNITSFDLSPLGQNIGGTITLTDCINLTSVTMPTSTNTVGVLAQNTALTVLDLTSLTGLGTILQAQSSPNLTTLLLPSSSEIFTSSVIVSSCDLSYVDFTPMPNFLNRINGTLSITNNNMTVGEVNAILADLEGMLDDVLNYTGRTIDIAGSNAAPDNGIDVAIIAVNTGSKTFTVASDQTAYFPERARFTVTGSTGNDGTYTVVSAVFGTDTVVTVVEAIPDATVDGNIVTPDGANAKTNLNLLSTVTVTTS